MEFVLNSPARTRSWWGVFVSLLASIALAVAMVAVPTPAEAQTNGVGASGTSIDTVGGGYPVETDSPYGATKRVTEIIHVRIGGVDYRGYCIEASSGSLEKYVEGTVVDWDGYLSLIHI